MSIELSKDLFDDFVDAVEKHDIDFIRTTLTELRVADISAILDEMDMEQCIYVMNLLDRALGAEIISNLDEYTRTDFLQYFEPNEIAEWMNQLDSDDVADILGELSLRIREKTLAFVDDDLANHVMDLLSYDDDSAGGLMAKELIRANVNWTVVQAVEEIRRQAENVEKFYALYVIDDQNMLLGRVSLKKIVLSNANTRIADIYEKDVVSVKTYHHQDDVAEIMQKYDLEAVPVINAKGELVGRVTIDDIVDVITEKAELDRQLMSGLTEDIAEDDDILTLTRARLPWLIIGMFGGLLGAQFIGLFEKDLVLVPAMAFFIPLITATGGNVGIQSSSIILQSLASQTAIAQVGIFRRLFKVLLVAILNGLVIALIVFGFSFLMSSGIKLGMTVAIALFCVVLLASIMGTITPLILDRININPAVASGPFITTANDLLGLAVYFTTAHFFYN